MAYSDLDIALAMAPLYYGDAWQPGAEGFSVFDPSKQAAERKELRHARGARRWVAHPPGTPKHRKGDQEKRKKSNAEWRDRNREALRAQNAAYREANRDKIREGDAARRTGKRKLLDSK